MIDTPHNQEEIRDEKGRFVPGVSGNPAGRPPGKTLKEFAREFYMLKTDEEKKAYLEKVEEKRPGFAWEMAEGKAAQSTDVTSKGEKITFVPAELLDKHGITSEHTPSSPSTDSVG